MNFKYKVKPWDHQHKGVMSAIKHREFAFFYEVGAGKSKTCIDTLRYKYQEAKRLMPTLVLCPPIVIKNWKKEILFNSMIPATQIVLLQGTGKNRLKLLQEMLRPDSIVVTNYESLNMKPIMDFFRDTWKPEVVVADEAHYLKNPKAKRSKHVYELGDAAKYRYVLTGTPILNTPFDIFGLYRFLDKGDRFGTNQYLFRSKYFFDKNDGMPKHNYFPNWQPIPSKMDDLSKIMGEVSAIALKKDCLDLPPLVKKIVSVPLGRDQKAVYESMRKDFLAFVDGGVSTANLALTKALRLQQIASGFLKIDDSDKVHLFKDNPKREALKSLLETITPSSKVIVWCIFKQDYETIRGVCEELKIKAVEVHGEISQKQKDSNVDEFNNSPETKVFIGHPKSGGIGINLVSSNYTIYFSRSFSLGDDIQSEARNYRGGSEIHSKVTRIDIVSEGTIDEVVAERLQSKLEMSSDILEKTIRGITW